MRNKRAIKSICFIRLFFLLFLAMAATAPPLAAQDKAGNRGTSARPIIEPDE